MVSALLYKTIQTRQAGREGGREVDNTSIYLELCLSGEKILSEEKVKYNFL